MRGGQNTLKQWRVQRPLLQLRLRRTKTWRGSFEPNKKNLSQRQFQFCSGLLPTDYDRNIQRSYRFVLGLPVNETSGPYGVDQVDIHDILETYHGNMGARQDRARARAT